MFSIFYLTSMIIRRTTFCRLYLQDVSVKLVFTVQHFIITSSKVPDAIEYRHLSSVPVSFKLD